MSSCYYKTNFNIGDVVKQNASEIGSDMLLISEGLFPLSIM